MNERDEDFEFIYVSPQILRGQSHEFVLIYKDAEGQVDLGGYEPGHASGGLLYVPAPAHWDRLIPHRAGQREVIVGRLLGYLRGNESLRALERSVDDATLLEQWPGEYERLRRIWFNEVGLSDRDLNILPPRRPVLPPVPIPAPPPSSIWQAPVPFGIGILIFVIWLIGLVVRNFDREPSLEQKMRESRELMAKMRPMLLDVEGSPRDLARVAVDPARVAFDTLPCGDLPGVVPTRSLQVSAGAVGLMAEDPREFPVGTYIIKDVVESATGKTTVLAMQKREPGFDPVHHDWSYQRVVAFTPRESGRIESCIACHSAAADSDFVFNRATR